MAGPKICHNPPPTSGDKLAEGAPTKSNGTSTPTLVIFCIPTLALAQVPAFDSGQLGRYTNKDL